MKSYKEVLNHTKDINGNTPHLHRDCFTPSPLSVRKADQKPLQVPDLNLL